MITETVFQRVKMKDQKKVCLMVTQKAQTGSRMHSSGTVKWR